MKKNAFILLAVLTVAAVLSCTKEIDRDTPEMPGEKGKKTLVFTAHIADGPATKTSLDGVDVVWSEDDAINAYLVLPEENYWWRYPSLQTEIVGDGAIAKFTVDVDERIWGKTEYEGIQIACYASYTPFQEYGQDVYMESFEAIPVFIPSMQYIPDGGGFANGANVAVAYVSDPDNLYFRNVGGLVAVKIKGSGSHEIETIRISGTEQGGGAMTGQTWVKVSKENAITSVSCTGSDYVMLARKDLVPMDPDFVCYAVVAPGTYTDVTISFTDKDGYTATYVKKTDLVVTSNSNQLIGGFDIPDSKWSKEGNIDFADANVKDLLVGRFDMDEDGEISYAEAEAVTSLDGLFSYCGSDGIDSDESKPAIASFDEFRFFTGITSLEDYAFVGCDKLTSILLPKSLTDIGAMAFSGSALFTITIPDQVVSIGEKAFQRCERLESVTLPPGLERIEDYLFWGCMALTGVSIPENVTYIGNFSFANANVESLDIPENVEYIGEAAFSSCHRLKEINWPERVTTIERSTFLYCSELTSFDFPESLQSIETEAFEGSGLTEVSLPEGIYNVGDRAFAGTRITKLVFPNVMYLGEGVFERCVLLEEIIMPDEVWDLGEGTFAECSGLMSVTLPETLWSTGDKVFYKCSQLQEVTISEGVHVIGSEAFAECGRLRYITIPGTVSEIGENAFYKCTRLQKVTMADASPEEDEYYEEERRIDDGAFAGCSNLGEFVFPSRLNVIGVEAFADSGISQVPFGDISGLWYIGARAFSHCPLHEIVLPEWSYDEDLEMGEGIFEGCERLVSVIIPEGYPAVPEGCFDGCIRLASIDLPATVTWIGSRAFRNCALTSVVIPGEEFYEFDDEVFSGCGSLTSLTLLSQDPAFDYYYLGDSVFDGTPDSFRVYVPADLVDSYKGSWSWEAYADLIEAIPAEP